MCTDYLLDINTKSTRSFKVKFIHSASIGGNTSAIRAVVQSHNHSTSVYDPCCMFPLFLLLKYVAMQDFQQFCLQIQCLTPPFQPGMLPQMAHQSVIPKYIINTKKCGCSERVDHFY